MKKHCFRQILVLTMVVVSTAAMSQYTPEYGDTIWGHLPAKYYAPWWIYDDWTLTSTEDSVHACMFTDTTSANMIYAVGIWQNYVVRPMTTNRPLRILGLAGVAIVATQSFGNMVIDDTTSLSESDYFILCDSIAPQSLRVLDSLEWSNLDPYRTLAIPVKLHNGLGGCSDVTDTTLFFKIREYYFNQPVTLHNTFFVGVRSNSVYSRTLVDETTGQWAYGTRQSYGALLSISTGSVDGCPSKLFEEMMLTDLSDYPSYPSPGRTRLLSNENNNFMLLFPIIEPLPENPQDTFSCPEPSGLGLMDKDAGSVWLRWQSHPDQSFWTVGYCEAGQDFDSLAQTVDCTANELVRISGLRPATEYEIRVQAHCDHSDSLYLSDWSASLLVTTDTLWINDSTFVLGGDTIVIPHNGIWDVSDSRGQISVFPNPTTDDVTIDCGKLRVEMIELLDLQGRVLMRKDCSLASPIGPSTGGSFILSLKGIPPGAYLIRVRTAEEVFSRRVVKE